MNLSDVEVVLGPAVGWKGRCYDIASSMVTAGLVDGSPIYGHWLGTVAPSSMFADKAIVTHGWVLRPDGSVVDPTRWVFEDVEPYIYEGPCDFYDEGGDNWRAAHNPEAPKPDDSREWVGLTFQPANESALLFVQSMYRGTRRALVIGANEHHLDIRMNQAFHLANLAYSQLGEHAEPVFHGLATAGMKSLVPMDNWKRMERESEARTVSA